VIFESQISQISMSQQPS